MPLFILSFPLSLRISLTHRINTIGTFGIYVIGSFGSDSSVNSFLNFLHSLSLSEQLKTPSLEVHLCYPHLVLGLHFRTDTLFVGPRASDSYIFPVFPSPSLVPFLSP